MNTSVEQLIGRPFHLLGEPPMMTPFTPAPWTLQMHVNPVQAAALGLASLWQEQDLPGSPLIFRGIRTAALHRQHMPYLLNRLVGPPGKSRSRPRFGRLARWELLPPPSVAPGIAPVCCTGPLLEANLLSSASPTDKGTMPGPQTGWFRYDFSTGWSALAVMLLPDEDQEAITLTALPYGRQDEWLAFVESLEVLHNRLLQRERRGRIEILGDLHAATEAAIRTCTFEHVILPEETLAQVASQRRIFDQDLLARYASFGVPRLRKVLLVGPPGTGKTTLLKAEAVHHASKGGYVLYVFSSPNAARSWQRLSYALNQAAASRLPTLILVEDFEQFVSEHEDPQHVLNTLDGIETPDNPAGTLLLATSNAPEQIDPRIKDRPGRIDLLIEIGLIEREDLAVRFLQRFLGAAYVEEEHAPLAGVLLKQAGSHIREVCLLGAIRSLEANRTVISRDDLLWAHDTLLNGRAIAAEPGRCSPPPAKKRAGLGFGKHHSRT